MTLCGPRSLCQIVRSTCASIKYPGQQPHPQLNQVGTSATPSLQPDQVEMPATPPPQPEQVEMSPQYELMESDIPEDMPDITDIQEEVLSDFDAWVHSVLDYELWWNIY